MDVSIIATGNAYAIGWLANEYVIWDIRAAGRPVVYRWARDQMGWQAGADQFYRLEAIDLRSDDPTHSAISTVVHDTNANTTVSSPSGKNSMATVGGIFGIVAMFTSLIPIIGILFGLFLGVLAIVFSGIGLNNVNRVSEGKAMATVGLVLGVLTVIFKLIPGVNLL